MRVSRSKARRGGAAHMREAFSQDAEQPAGLSGTGSARPIV